MEDSRGAGERGDEALGVRREVDVVVVDEVGSRRAGRRGRRGRGGVEDGDGGPAAGGSERRGQVAAEEGGAAERDGAGGLGRRRGRAGLGGRHRWWGGSGTEAEVGDKKKWGEHEGFSFHKLGCFCFTFFPQEIKTR